MLACLIQIDGWDPVAGAAVTLRAASHDDPALCHLNSLCWWPAIAKLPTLRYDLFDGAFGDKISAPTASCTLAIEAWPDFARYSLADARFRLWTAELGSGWGTFELRFDGRLTEQPAVKDFRADLSVAADDRWLDGALLSTYAGTGGAEGPAAMKGEAKPLAIGKPRYIPGKLTDPANSIFQLSAGAIHSVEASLERLARFGAASANYANRAALVAATIAAGTWATSLSDGHVRFGAPPTGQISFLVEGDEAGAQGWVRTPGKVIRRLALLSDGVGKIDDASLDALDVARPYNVSRYLDTQTTARTEIQQLAASLNCVAGVSWLGKLFVATVGLGAPWLTLAADGTALPPVEAVEQLPVAPPFMSLGMTAERTYAVHELADIAFTATLIDRGPYSSTETYREGNIVTLADGSRYIFIATTPAAGNAPPNVAYWALFTGSSRNVVTRGPIAPSSPIDGDMWVDTSATPRVVKVRVSGAWQDAANYVAKGSDIDVADGATADGKLSPLGTATVTIDGNSATKTGGGGAYNGGAVGQPQQGPCWVSARHNGGSFYGIVALDDDGTSNLNYTNDLLQAQYYNSGSGYGVWFLASNGTQLKIGTTAQVPTANSVLRLEHDGRYAHVVIDGKTVCSHYFPLGANVTLWPKWALYYDGTYNELRSGTMADVSDAPLLTPTTNAAPTTAFVAVRGSTITSLAGGISYSPCVAGPKLTGSMWVGATVDPNADYVMLSFDDDATAWDWGTQLYVLHFYRVTGAWTIYSNGVAVAVGTSASGITGTIRMAIDGTKLRLFLGTHGEVQSGITVSSTSLSLWPKWWAYNPGAVIRNCDCGPFTENNFASIGGATKGADYATNDQRFFPLGSSTAANISGNTLTNGGSDAHNWQAVGNALPGTSRVWANVTPGNVYTTVALSTTASFTSFMMRVQLLYNPATGDTRIRSGDESGNYADVYATTLTTGVTGRMELGYDGVGFTARIGNLGQVWSGTISAFGAIPEGATFYPKVSAYNSGMKIEGMGFGPFFSNRWADNRGFGLPADNATADLLLTAVGACIVNGNTLTKNAGSGNSYGAAVVARAQTGPQAVECLWNASNANCGMVALDDDATSFAYASQLYYLELYGGGNWTFYVNGTPTRTGYVGPPTNGQTRFALGYDNRFIHVIVDGSVLTSYPVAANLTLNAKVLAYSEGVTIRGIRAYGYSDATLAPVLKVLTGSALDANYALVGDRFINRYADANYLPVAVGTQQTGPCHASATISDSGWTVVALDNDDTSYNYNDQSAIAFYRASDGANGLYIDNVGYNMPVVIAGISGTMRLAYDGQNFIWTLGSQGKVLTRPTTADRKLFPKFYAYNLNSPTRDIDYGPYGEAVIPGQANVSIEADKTISADYQGNVTGTYPVYAPNVLRNSLSIKTDAVVTYQVVRPSDSAAGSGGAFTADGGTITLDNTAGSATKGNVTANSFAAGSNLIKWQLVVLVNGIAVAKRTCTLSKLKADAPTSGGGSGSGGGTSKIATFPANLSTSSGSYSSVSNAAAVKITVASGEKIYVTLNAGYSADESTSGGRAGVFKARYATNSGMSSPTDLGSAVTGTAAFPSRLLPNGEYSDPADGSISFAQSLSVSPGDYWVDMQFYSSVAGRGLSMIAENVTVEAKA